MALIASVTSQGSLVEEPPPVRTEGLTSGCTLACHSVLKSSAIDDLLHRQAPSPDRFMNSRSLAHIRHSDLHAIGRSPESRKAELNLYT